MTLAAALLRASAEFDPNTVTPGVIGFVAVFLIALITVFLIFDMQRRIRRTRYRSELAAELDAEAAAANAEPREPGDAPPQD